MMKKNLLLGLLFSLIATVGVYAQDDYNYAEIKKKKSVTPAALTKTIKDYVADKTNDKGYYLVNDPVQDKTLKLQLIDVHKDCYEDMGEDIYFVCGNFKGVDGRIYDLDFFFKKKNGKMKNTMTKVHKVNFVSRYNWYLVDGKWIAKPVKDGGDAHKTNDRPHATK